MTSSIIGSLPSLHRLRVAVVGAGVLGLSVAALAAQAGARVAVFEPRPLADNASGIAAGMLSPGLEAALDPEETEFRLLLEGYGAWPQFATTLGLPAPEALHAGALYVDTIERLQMIETRLEVLGVASQRVAGEAARALQPILSPDIGEGLHIADDGRIDPVDTLARLVAQLRAAGGDIVQTACSRPPSGYDAVVLAAGFEARSWVERVPELEALQPIKGHVLHFHDAQVGGPTLRAASGYAAPQPRGLVFGATMEAGRADRAIDAQAVRRLHAAALALAPTLADAPYVARAGVRAATRSGRPMAARSESGVYLAVGARRNGWLLAPLIAATLVEQLAGGAARPEFSVGAAPPA